MSEPCTCDDPEMGHVCRPHDEPELVAAEARIASLTEALERIAMFPCENLNGGECPDYWAIGLSKEPCPSCIAREAA